ncbi:Methionine--tRNA ligase [Cellulomonas flavigena DSM 20109]|uniref:Methionine--tRNA ligase n=1 Tax=Cellulomonas flavigena (strain ATCC 482 / DSM 20109 / BCRC 11376 / JCM 18109 / NBRC 3775 / NCIMB 8073 / NRS 134) TaxID=446466 RepID=D5UDN9_CELFN|nr:class I tRNA ligase family protein [Cellulomonas flavigena]ADG76495.1 Methionine--tRNA ligase [Cellulomonas flavigena DSM 20109]
MNGTTLVISPAPTANGDLHLGHVAGPFLAADVHTRYLRATGRRALLATGTQDTSTYVVTTAHRRGLEPRELARASTAQVEAGLAALGIDVHAFTRDEDAFTKAVLQFFEGLYTSGKLELRTMAFPYNPATGAFLADGFARGGCPHCLAAGCAGLCESCGHVIAAGDLIDPVDALDPTAPVELRDVDVLVLPLERYRARIREHLAQHGGSMRPHMAQAVAEMLSHPLADLPVTFPVSWGIPAPFPEVSGQSINPNAEPAAWSIYCGAVAAEASGTVGPGDDALWRSDADTRVVYFLGFDNTYPFAIGAVAMLLATDGRHLVPADFLTNEFYELDSAKFSTSRGHVVWASDLVRTVSRDLVRFHLAATSPESQRTDFTHAALARVTSARLVEPWNRVVDRMDALRNARSLPVSPRSRLAAQRIRSRFAACYELEHFSLTRAADVLAEQLARLAAWDLAAHDAGDFCHEVEVVLRCAAPLLVDLSQQALADVSFPDGAGPSTAEPLSLPRLVGRLG